MIYLLCMETLILIFCYSSFRIFPTHKEVFSLYLFSTLLISHTYTHDVSFMGLNSTCDISFLYFH